MNVWFIVLLIVVGVAVLAGLVVGLVFLILWGVQSVGGTKGGLRRLAEVFPAANPPQGRVFQRETVKVGAVVYKRCVTLGIAEEGFYISTFGMTAMIPWDAFTEIGQATLYWQKRPMLTVGDPPVATIIVPVSVFDLMHARLPKPPKKMT